MQDLFFASIDAAFSTVVLVCLGLLVLCLAIVQFLQGGLEGFAREYNQKVIDGKENNKYHRDLWIMLGLIAGTCLLDYYRTASALLALLIVLLTMSKYIHHIRNRMLAEKPGV